MYKTSTLSREAWRWKCQTHQRSRRTSGLNRRRRTRQSVSRAFVLLFEYVLGARVNTDNYIFSLWSWDRARPQREPRRIIPALHVGCLRKRGLTCGRSDYAVTEAHGGDGMVRWWHNWYHSGGLLLRWPIGQPHYVEAQLCMSRSTRGYVSSSRPPFARDSPGSRTFSTRPTRGNDTERKGWLSARVNVFVAVHFLSSTTRVVLYAREK